MTETKYPNYCSDCKTYKCDGFTCSSCKHKEGTIKDICTACLKDHPTNCKWESKHENENAES